jgi:hypothetical protein
MKVVWRMCLIAAILCFGSCISEKQFTALSNHNAELDKKLDSLTKQLSSLKSAGNENLLLAKYDSLLTSRLQVYSITYPRYNYASIPQRNDYRFERGLSWGYGISPFFPSYKNSFGYGSSVSPFLFPYDGTFWSPSFRNPSDESYWNSIPTFSNPPPSASESKTLESSKWSVCKSLKQFDSILTDAFKSCGYDERYYFLFEGGGFAIASSVEEINEDGRVEKLPRSQSESFFDAVFRRIKSSLSPSTKSKRCVVFVVSANLNSLNIGAGRTVPTFSEFNAWFETQYRKLPDTVGAQPAKNMEVVALLYEFEHVLNSKDVWNFQSKEKRKTNLSDFCIVKRFEK